MIFFLAILKQLRIIKRFLILKNLRYSKLSIFQKSIAKITFSYLYFLEVLFIECFLVRKMTKQIQL